MRAKAGFERAEGTLEKDTLARTGTASVPRAEARHAATLPVTTATGAAGAESRRSRQKCVDLGGDSGAR